MSAEGRAGPAGARSEGGASADGPGTDAGPANSGSELATASAEDEVVVFILPGQLRDLSGGRSRVAVPAPESGTLEDAFDSLHGACPAIHERIFNETREIRPHINVFVDGDDIRWAGGLQAPVRVGSEVVVLPAVSGG